MNRMAIKIKEARIKAGLSEKELAKKCGLSVNYIIQIESGKKIINEKAADNILNSLGEKVEMLEDLSAKEEKEIVAKPVKKPTQTVNYAINPSPQWESALAGVLKKYAIVDCYTDKVIGYKELPIIGKKVEGHNPDRLLFVQASNNEMESLRVKRGDVVTVMMTSEVENNQLYVLEISGKRIIRQLRRENNKLRLSKGAIEFDDQLIDLKTAHIIGKCIKVEFDL
ncbi:MAG: helix-turn-helix domain-containing protein [Clostridia bacterium]|nr:helix-turn-helix domain-containing protein [Clostridia bacterium]